MGPLASLRPAAALPAPAPRLPKTVPAHPENGCDAPGAPARWNKSGKLPAGPPAAGESFSSGSPGGCPQVGSLTPCVRAGPLLYAAWRLTSSVGARPPFVSPFSSVLVSRFLPRAAALVYAVPSGLSPTDKFDLCGLDKYRVILCVGFQSYIHGIDSHVAPTRLQAPPGASGAQGIASGGGGRSRAFPVPGRQTPGASRESLSSFSHCTERPVVTPSSWSHCADGASLSVPSRVPPVVPRAAAPVQAPAPASFPAHSGPPGGCYHDRGGGQGRPRRQGPGRERVSRRVAQGLRFRRGAGAPRVPPSCRGERAGEGKGSVKEEAPTVGPPGPVGRGGGERRKEKRTEGRSRPGGSREAGGAGGRASDRRFSTLAAQQHPREPWQVPTLGPPQLTSDPCVSRAGA